MVAHNKPPVLVVLQMTGGNDYFNKEGKFVEVGAKKKKPAGIQLHGIFYS